MNPPKPDYNSADYFQNIASLLLKKYSKDNKNKKIAKVKEVLTFLAQGGYIIFNMTRMPVSSTQSLIEINKEWENWKYFNKGYLRGTIKRMQKQKLVEFSEENGRQVITITQNGKKKVLQYTLDQIELTKKVMWDKKWRLVIYDIPKGKRKLQHLIRKSLKKMEFYKIQQSVYLTPYPCFEEIEFLRQYYNLEDEIKIFTVTKIESETAYLKFFGLA